MITAAFEYARPGSVDEAQALLTKFGDDSKVIAGGQSLIPLMRTPAQPAHSAHRHSGY